MCVKVKTLLSLIFSYPPQTFDNPLFSAFEVGRFHSEIARE